MPVEKTLHLNACTMSYISFGGGRKNLIIIPGLSLNRVKGSSMPLSLAYRIFAKDYRVYMFDERDEIDESCTIEQMADDLYEAMKTVGIKQADILSVSMGGMIALSLAKKHPECIGKMIIAFSSSGCAKMTEERIHGWLKAAEKQDYETLTKDFMESVYTESYMKKYRLMMPVLVKMTKKADLSRFAHQAKAILKFDLYDELPNMNVNAYVIGAEKDRIVPYEESLRMAEKLKCESYIYENYGHGAYDEAKDFNQRVLSVFRGESR